MKRLTATTVLSLVLFSTAFVSGKGSPSAPDRPDSLQSVWFYTEGIKQRTIAGNTSRAREYFREAIRRDSSYAPAWYELAGSLVASSPDEAVDAARRACRLDTANRWYQQFYGQTLLMTDRMAEALMRNIIRNMRMAVENPRDYTARSNLLWDSTLSENRLIKLGKRCDFTCHLMAHQLGAYTDCNHGRAVAVLHPVYYRHIYRSGLKNKDKLITIRMEV